MALISISNLTFSYPSSFDEIFKNVNLQIDTDWKLGLIGRNGRGKTTLLKLLRQERLESKEFDFYDGKIISATKFSYFPFEVKNKNLPASDILSELSPQAREWEILREMNFLDMQAELLYQNFSTLSGGEQTKLLLIALFLKENNFLLIDEPTNHLDFNSRKIVSDYLKSKKGYILISHDRNFLDNSVDHILSINKKNIELQKGNFSSYLENKKLQDEFELKTNKKLQSEIKTLSASAKKIEGWSNAVEKTKFNSENDAGGDRGWIGHKSAKMMKRSKNVARRRSKAIEEKKDLLRNIETVEEINLNTQDFHKNILGHLKNVSIFYDDKLITQNFNLEIIKGERICLVGNNGSGKSSLLKLLTGENIKYTGEFETAKNLKVSYIPQKTNFLKGGLDNFIHEHDLNETKFKTLLVKLDFSNRQFEKPMEDYSDGQRKKVLIAKSLVEDANLYIWDEVLNYIDIFSRIQLENLILKENPTMIFVEHDISFREKISTVLKDI